jgi:hypothetical protein
MKYVIQSASEEGFWSNEDGWVDREGATVFEEHEIEELELPESRGHDAQWVPA